MTDVERSRETVDRALAAFDENVDALRDWIGAALRHPSSVQGDNPLGEPLVLSFRQEALLRGRLVGLYRGEGKTVLSVALALAGLCGPLMPAPDERAEVVHLSLGHPAADRQAFDIARDMLREDGALFFDRSKRTILNTGARAGPVRVNFLHARAVHRWSDWTPSLVVTDEVIPPPMPKVNRVLVVRPLRSDDTAGGVVIEDGA